MRPGNKKEGDIVDYKLLYNRRDKLKMGIVPKKVLFLTSGVDVQKDRLEAIVVGWGKDKQSFVVDYRILIGDTSSPEVWDELEEFLYNQYETELGQEMPIQKMCVDSGYNTQVVYNWVRKFSANKVMAIKGSESLQTMVGTPKGVDINLNGKSIKNGVRLWNLGVNIIKSELYGRLKIPEPTDNEIEEKGYPYGYVHFNKDLDEEFFKMLCAETLAAKTVRGYRKYYYEKHYDRNESLDTFVYARAGANIFGLDRFKEKDILKLEKNIGKDFMERSSKTRHSSPNKKKIG